MPAGKEGRVIKVRDDMLLIGIRSAQRLEFGASPVLGSAAGAQMEATEKESGRRYWTRSVGRIHFKTILSEIQVVDIIAADPVEYLTRRIRVSPKPRQRSLILGIRSR
jgi:hypothetical protein